MIGLKLSLILCQFLYTCLVFYCVIFRSYVCFSVLGQIWKEIEEMSRNRAKMSKKGNLWRSWRKLGQFGWPVCQIWSTRSSKASALQCWSLVPRCQLSRNQTIFSFFSAKNEWTIDRMTPWTPLAIKGRLKSLARGLKCFNSFQNPREPVKNTRRRRSCSQDFNFLQFSATL